MDITQASELYEELMAALDKAPVDIRELVHEHQPVANHGGVICYDCPSKVNYPCAVIKFFAKMKGINYIPVNKDHDKMIDPYFELTESLVGADEQAKRFAQLFGIDFGRSVFGRTGEYAQEVRGWLYEKLMACPSCAKMYALEKVGDSV